MSKLYCQHSEDGVHCSFACLEYSGMTVTVVSRHTIRMLRKERHVNQIPILKLLEMAVSDGDGPYLLAKLQRMVDSSR